MGFLKKILKKSIGAKLAKKTVGGKLLGKTIAGKALGLGADKKKAGTSGAALATRAGGTQPVYRSQPATAPGGGGRRAGRVAQ